MLQPQEKRTEHVEVSVLRSLLKYLRGWSWWHSHPWRNATFDAEEQALRRPRTMTELTLHIETIVTALMSSLAVVPVQISQLHLHLHLLGWRRSVLSWVCSLCALSTVGDLSCVSAEVTDGLHQRVRRAGFETVKFPLGKKKETVRQCDTCEALCQAQDGNACVPTANNNRKVFAI